ncbi:helix-turn-helix domain-containing protein [Roseibium aggregatum]|uniref:helix-turn-helix domain-containing protein n=1 Tax=Roseibium aggregatum TaxID=187304 RepID=UPI001E2F3D1B|nr:helix-turn-helix domain-containing protein [Roseibium aggregatum]UES46521.1 helix-turn-helix domain-containing protein [Roseibium aggregatum]
MTVLTPKHLAERWSVSTATILSMCRDGELPHFRIKTQYRFHVSLIEEFEKTNVASSQPNVSGGQYAYSPRTLADRWQCSENHIRNLIKRGELPALSYGRGYRIRPETVEAIERGEKFSGSKIEDL